MESQPETSGNRYVLGSDEVELARLDRQAASIGPPTQLLLKAAGIGPGLRVLDLGTGLGHVARLAGQLVGPAGKVVGLDRAAQALAVARRRVEAAGEHHVSFVEGDVAGWRADEPFDAIVGRLVLFHLPDPVMTVRHHLQNLAPGRLFVALDFDIGAVRTEPPVGLVAEAGDWINRAFRAAGASPTIGARLGPILEQAGLDNVTTFGIQGYLPARGTRPLRRCSPALSGASRRKSPHVASPRSSNLAWTRWSNGLRTNCFSLRPCSFHRQWWARGDDGRATA